MTFFLLTLALLSLPLFAKQQPLSTFSGNQVFSDTELLSYLFERDLDLTSAQRAKPEQIERAARLLRQFYQDRGYPLATAQGHSNNTVLSFQIVEGPRARLGWVEFVGNQALPAQELQEFFDLNTYLDFNELDKKLDQIRRLYRDSGYPQVKVGSPEIEVLETETADHFPFPFRRNCQNRILLTIPINEGNRYRYGTLSLPKELSNLPSPAVESGEVYRLSDLLLLRQKVLSHFKNQGKLIKDLKIYQYIDEKTQRVNIDVRCELLPPLIVKKIEFVGNEHYPDSFYRRELKLEEEEILDAKKLEESLLQLKETGVLASLSEDDVELSVNEPLQETDVIIHLHERDRQRISFSLGQLGGIEPSVFYSITNLLGLGEKLGLDVSLGSQTSAFALNLASAYLPGTQVPLSLFLRFFRRHTAFKLPGIDKRLHSLFRTEQLGFSGGGSYKIRSNHQVGLTATAEQVTHSGSSKHFVLEPFWTRSKMEGQTETERTQLSYRFSIFQGSVESWNIRPNFDYERSLTDLPFRSSDFRLHIHASHAHFFKGPAPLSERLFGNSQLFRGFKSPLSGPWAKVDDQILPIGGDTLFAINSECRIPLSRNFSLVPFVDSGFVGSFSPLDDYQLIDATNHVWKTSVGTEVGVPLPRQIPTARLIFSWNPLRLDQEIFTPGGLARLRDPTFAFRVTF